jgi:hypothetical protein
MYPNVVRRSKPATDRPLLQPHSRLSRGHEARYARPYFAAAEMRGFPRCPREATTARFAMTPVPPLQSGLVRCGAYPGSAPYRQGIGVSLGGPLQRHVEGQPRQPLRAGGNDLGPVYDRRLLVRWRSARGGGGGSSQAWSLTPTPF